MICSVIWSVVAAVVVSGLRSETLVDSSSTTLHDCKAGVPDQEESPFFDAVSIFQRARLLTSGNAPALFNSAFEANASLSRSVAPQQSHSAGTPSKGLSNVSSAPFKLKRQAESPSMLKHKRALEIDTMLVIAGTLAVVATLILFEISDGPRTNEDAKVKTHSYLYSMLSPHSHRPQAIVYRCFTGCIVLINVAALILESNEEYERKHAAAFQVLEAVSSWIFLIEYSMRLFVIPRSTRYQHKSPIRARLLWMITLESIIDLFALAPWFIESIVDLLHPGSYLDLPNLTWLRIFRLLRLVKVTFISESLDVFARVLYYNAEILFVSLVLCAMLILLLSVLLFYVAPKNDTGGADYSSIAACMYLAVMMLTGQGEPEGVMPWYTKIVVCITCVFAVGLFAIQASMLTWGFENEAERRIKKNRRNQQNSVKAILGGLDPNAEEVSSSSEDEVDSDWEEYEENIAGDEFDSDAEEATFPECITTRDIGAVDRSFTPKQAFFIQKIFFYLDIGADGSISRHELEDIKDLNAKKIFHLMDQDKSRKISKQEFLRWLSANKAKHSPPIFKMLLEELLKACKARKDAQEEAEDINAMPKDFLQFARRFQALQLENTQLKKQVFQLQHEAKANAADTPQRSQSARQSDRRLQQ